MNRKCCERENFQPWPDKGKLACHQNMDLEKLKILLKNEREPVHTYIVRTVKRSANGSDIEFKQTGCGPNFQGDRITLCTCKYNLHSFNPKKTENPDLKFKGHWYAGFTGVKVDSSRNYLFYLMKVEKAFRSQKQIFEYFEDTNPKVIKAKNTTESAFGDLYQPKPNISDEWNPINYERPILGHKHYQYSEDHRWHKDIEYKGPFRRSAPLLGDDEYSYLWSKPVICKKSEFSSRCAGKLYTTLQELLSDLEQVKG